MSTKPNLAAFNQGAVPTIACFNKATVALGVDLDKLIAAMQHDVDQYVAPVWGTPAKLISPRTLLPERGPSYFSTMPTNPELSRITT